MKCVGALRYSKSGVYDTDFSRRKHMQIESVMVVVLILTTCSWMASVILAIVSSNKAERVGAELNKKADFAATQAGLAATQAGLAANIAVASAQDMGHKLDAIVLQTNGNLTELQAANKALQAQIERLFDERDKMVKKEKE